MNKQEQDLRNNLTDHEKELITNGFSICDIVWGRINKEKSTIRNPEDLSNFYYLLHSNLKILNSNKDYRRALLCAAMIINFDSSGLDIYSLDDGKIKYHTPERTVIVTTGIQYIFKHRKYIDLRGAVHGIQHSNNLLKNVLPFSYINNDQLLLIFKDFYNRYSNHDFSLRNLCDYSDQFDFSNKIDFLKSKGWLHEDEVEKTWDEIFKEIDEME